MVFSSKLNPLIHSAAFLPPNHVTLLDNNQHRRPKIKETNPKRRWYVRWDLSPGQQMTPPDTLSCNRSPWLTFTITMVTQPTSGDLFGIPLQCTLREHARGAELFLRYGERKGKHRPEGDKLNCGFHCKFVSHKHEGGKGRKRDYSGMAAIET